MLRDRAPAVLHITAAAGGGADRYVRDLAASTMRRHYLLHVGPAIDVLEDVAANAFVPLAGVDTDRATGALLRWREAAGVGIAHVHGVDSRCRARLAAMRSARALPHVVTLHDLLFVNPDAFAATGMPPGDAAWIAAMAPVMNNAAAVIVPSEFLRRTAVAAVPDIRTTVVAPGLGPRFPGAEKAAPAAPADFAAARPRHLVAVVGAVGPHKGSGLLDALAAAFEGTDIGIVVIGYTDTRLTRGWVVPGRYYVHGPYEDEDLAGWLAAYDASLVLFPNRLPESFSYTLSEVWAAGVPAIVPDEGALGARVARHGGGWRLAAGFSAGEAAALIGRLFSPSGEAERTHVKSELAMPDPQRIPSLSTMSREIEALYARFALPSPLPADPGAARRALAPLLAANCNGFVFRKELLNLASQLQQTSAALAAARERGAELERSGAAWAAKLEVDIASLRRELTSEQARFQEEVRRAGVEKTRLEARNRAFADDSTRRIAENRALAIEIENLGELTRRLGEQSERVAAINARLAEENALLQERNRTLAADYDRIESERQHLDERVRRLEQGSVAMQRDLSDEIARAQDENRRLAADKAALDLLPRFIGDYLRQRILRGRR